SSNGEDYTVLARRLVRLALLVLMRRLPGSNPVPWGILRGVRPGKIAHRLFDQGLAPAELANRLVAEYGLEPVKAELITDIAAYQRSVISDEQAAVRNKKVSIYIGIPYCPSRCLYCSFPSYVLPERRELDAFLRAIKRDIENAAQLITKFNLSVESIYMGGGTPTSLPAADLSSLLALIDSEIRSVDTREFTVEAGRPDSIDQEKIAALRQYQINRVSINPQTMQDKTLKQIGRRHTAQDIIDIFGKIRLANIPLINMDIIAGLPGETEADMEDTMGQIAAINPDNVTIHTLALKRGSRLKEALTTGMLSGSALPNEEITKQMLMISQAYMTK
ncbi:MAG: coproporphyrinogen dehydrogenase HemZ, partial [Sporomusa sp.]